MRKSSFGHPIVISDDVLKMIPEELVKAKIPLQTITHSKKGTLAADGYYDALGIDNKGTVYHFTSLKECLMPKHLEIFKSRQKRS